MTEPHDPTSKPVLRLRLPTQVELSRRGLILGSLGLICSVFLAVGAIAYLRQNTAAVGIPGTIASRVSFPLYFPLHAPAGLTLDAQSFTATSQVVSYTYTYNATKHLIVNIQPLTSAIDVTSFNPTSQFTTAIGQAYLVDLDDRTTAAVVTPKSFILINAPNKISTDLLTQFINDLQLSH